MYSTETKIRVRYSETDQMGFVYYGNYATYYEVARAEMMRELGITYKEMEAKGCMMPMIEMSVNYLKPAFYDDLLRIKTSVEQMPASRMHFEYEIYNDVTGQLLNTGKTTLTFINRNSYKPMRAPEWFIELINARLKKDNIELKK